MLASGIWRLGCTGQVKVQSLLAECMMTPRRAFLGALPYDMLNPVGSDCKIEMPPSYGELRRAEEARRT